jgi:hypothetical protein
VKLVVLTCLWQRPRLTKLVLQRYQTIRLDLKGRAEVQMVAVGSEGESSRALAEEYGWSYVEAPNRPLGAKWNAGMAFVRGLAPDGVVIVGSDDWLTTSVFDFHMKALRDGCLVSGLLDIYFLYYKTMKTIHFGGYTHDRMGESLGLGRCLSREALQSVNWQPWWPKVNRGLDLTMTKTLRKKWREVLKERTRVTRLADIGACALDIKTPIGICKFHSYVGSRTKGGKSNVTFVPTEAFLREHFPSREAERLLSYVRSVRGGSTP